MADQHPIPEHLRDLFESEESILEAELDRIRDEYDHGTLKGTDAEHITRGFLKKYLPSTFGYGNGQIIDSNGNRSKEVDIAICNPSHPFTYSETGQGVLFLEGVDAVIESKSIFNEQHIESALKNCRSVRNLEPNYGDAIYWGNEDKLLTKTHAVFAYESPYTVETLVDKILEKHEELDMKISQGFDLVYVKQRGLITQPREGDSMKITHDESGESLVGAYAINNYGHDLIQFLMFLSGKMPYVIAVPDLLPNYLNPEFKR